MQDNVSIVLTIIVMVIIIVIFPLYNYFERQDNMSYNLVLKATANFTDDVLNKGYLDQDMYDNYISQLSNTGNLYNVELEAHRKVITADSTNNGEQVEQYRIEYNEDIFDENRTKASKSNIIDVSNKVLKDDVYLLNVGDMLYVKLKNTSTTMAGAIFSGIVPTATKDRIAVNYGGIVKNNTWETSKDTRFVKNELSTFLNLHKNLDSKAIATSGSRKKLDLYINNIADRRISYEFKVLNVDKDTKLAEVLKGTMSLEGLVNSKKPTSVSCDDGEVVKNCTIVFDVTLEDLGYDNSRIVYAVLPANVIFGSFKGNIAISTNRDTDTIVEIFRNSANTSSNRYRIEGPYDPTGSYLVNNIIVTKSVVYYLYYDKTQMQFRNNNYLEELKYEYITRNGFFHDNVDTAYDVVDESSRNRIRITVNNTYIRGDKPQTVNISIRQGFLNIINNKEYTESPKLNSNKFTIHSAWQFSYSKSKETYTFIDSGSYRFSLWGAQGGNGDGGLGGFTSGVKTFSKGDVIYLNVGGTNGYNGGGGYYGGRTDEYVGGGATDIRTLSFTNSRDEYASLMSRIIVAGGGRRRI